MGLISLSRTWSVDQVQKAIDGDLSQREPSANFLRERYTERFLDPIKILAEKSAENKENQDTDDTWRYGFSIVSLCCLLVETFASYRRGLPSSNRRELEGLEREFKNISAKYRLCRAEFPSDGAEVYRCFFLAQEKFFAPIEGGRFYQSIRNGLLHQAQTKDGWKITKNGKELWNNDKLTLDRTVLVIKLNDYFDAYQQELKDADWNSDVWRLTRRKLFWLCELSKPRGA